MSSPPSPLHIFSTLGGLTGWLAFSLAAHAAIFGWLATRSSTPHAHGSTVLQVSLVAGNGRTSAPELRGAVAHHSPPPANHPATAASSPEPPRVAPALAESSVTPATPAVGDELRAASTPSAIAIAVVAANDGNSDGTGNLDAPGAGAGTPLGAAAGSGASVSGGGGDREEARLARQMRPEYPPGALAKGWEGQVLLRLRISADGSVQTLRVERSSGYEILDRAAYRAAQNWLFFPARVAGVPVAAEVKVPVVFARGRE